MTVYDAHARSEISTDQTTRPCYVRLFELADADEHAPVDLYFGPEIPADSKNRWIKTIPGRGWFVFFRVYGPEEGHSTGRGRPGDFELES